MGAALLAGWLGASCLSPTLPLPPPEPPDTIDALGADGGPCTEPPCTLWRVQGDCTPGAIVMVFDESTGRGVIVEDGESVGRYSVVLEANRCDQGWVREQIEGDQSEPATFVVREMSPAEPSSGPCP